MRRGLAATDAMCGQNSLIIPSVLDAAQLALIFEQMPTPTIELGTCGTVIRRSSKMECQPLTCTPIHAISLARLILTKRIYSLVVPIPYTRNKSARNGYSHRVEQIPQTITVHIARPNFK
jgi:hypothetical protein